MSASLVHAIMFRFILGDTDLNENVGKIDLLYHYRFLVKDKNDPGYTVQYLNPRRLIDVDIPDDPVAWILKGNKYNIFNPDEAMNRDPERFMQYEGTIDQLIRDISNQPFNEVYWTHEEEYDHLKTVGPAQTAALENLPADPYQGNNANNLSEQDKANGILNQDFNYRIPHATMHFRQTPFQPKMWEQLPVMKIDDNNIIDYTLGRNDAEQYSVFSIHNDGMALEQYVQNIAPVTDDRQELERRYGYKYLPVTSDYFMNTSNLTGLSTQELANAIGTQDNGSQTMPADAWITYPSANTFNDYFGPDAANTIYKNVDPHLLQLVPMSPQEGGVQLYEDTIHYLNPNMQRFINDSMVYYVAQLMITFIDSLNGVTSPANSPSGDIPPRSIQQMGHDYAVRAYNRWSKDLSNLQAADQATNEAITSANDKAEFHLVRDVSGGRDWRYSNNCYRTWNGNTYVRDKSAPDPVITYQKAGQLMMHYKLVMSQQAKGNGDAISQLLKSSALTSLNPWLGQIEKPPKESRSAQYYASQQAYTARGALSAILTQLQNGAD